MVMEDEKRMDEGWEKGKEMMGGGGGERMKLWGWGKEERGIGTGIYRDGGNKEQEILGEGEGRKV